MVVALSNEDEKLVADYVEKMGLYDLRLAAGSLAAEAYGVKGYPTTVLIDPDGNIVWQGHPSSLSDSKVKDAVKGARKAPASAFLAFRPAEAPKDGALEGVLEKLADCDLKAAYSALDAAVTAAGESAAAAGKLRDQVDGFVTELRAQIEAAVAAKRVGVAVEAYEVLGKALAGRESGKQVTERLEEIRKDKALMAEIDAAEALEKADKVAEKRGAKKAVKQYEAVVKKFPGTKAAERAQRILESL